jgi:hypothetical protein
MESIDIELWISGCLAVWYQRAWMKYIGQTVGHGEEGWGTFFE